ncbi:MAG: M56 family metallopeptidase [Porticoccaceae bacterium]|nr:M56 family metallopeptidase [Porticoccaceae bacterium]
MIETLPVNLVTTAILWLLVAAVASVFTALMYPLYKKLLDRTAPQDEAFALMIYGLLPLAAAFLVMFLLNYPHLASALIPSHCHGQSCAPHRPELSLSHHGGTALIAIFAAVVFSVIVVIQRKIAVTRSRLKALHKLSREGGDISYRTIDSPKLLAWCTGLIKPRVYVSTGLVAALSSRQLEAVLVHESSHGLRRDNLRKAITGFATLLWPSLVRKRFLTDFAVATEKACDCLTAVKLKDSALVLEVIHLMAGANPGNKDPSQQRQDSLTRLQQEQKGNLKATLCNWLFITGLWVASIVILTGAAHLGVEWAIR